MSDRNFWLSEAQFARLRPLLPNKVHGVPRVDVGESCVFLYREDTFDEKIWAGDCMDNTTLVGITVLCRNNTTSLVIYTFKYMLKDGLRLRTALDGTETPA